jgi:hypothetical protein
VLVGAAGVTVLATAYVTGFVLVLFAVSAAQGDSTLVGWPLALAILTAIAGTRAGARA